MTIRRSRRRPRRSSRPRRAPARASPDRCRCRPIRTCTASSARRSRTRTRASTSRSSPTSDSSTSISRPRRRSTRFSDSIIFPPAWISRFDWHRDVPHHEHDRAQAGGHLMAAILAKKLGMTQRFLDDGRVERVTVLEAGPCPVTAIRTVDADGYEAVQLGFGAVREKALNKPLLGHLKKASAPPLKRLTEFRDEAGELTVGDTVTVEAFAVGQTVKISGIGKGK